MASDVRLCVIGAGAQALERLYPGFARLRGGHVAATADRDRERARAAASAYDLSASYIDYQMMLDAEVPDGVVVTGGPEFQAMTAMGLLRSGYRVLTTTPPAASSEQCAELATVQRQTGRMCMVGFGKRFVPAYVAAKRVVDGPEFGVPALFALSSMTGPVKSAADLFLGPAIDTIDLAPHFFGPVTQVRADRSARTAFGIRLAFANGATGTLELTNQAEAGRDWEHVVLTSGHTVDIRVTDAVEMVAHKAGRPFASHQTDGPARDPVADGYAGALQEFVDAIASNREPVSSIASACHTMALVEAIRDSAESGEPVDVVPQAQETS